MPRRARNIKPIAEIVVLRSEDDFEGRDFSRFHREAIGMLDLQALSFRFLRWAPRKVHYDYLVVTSPRVVQALKEGKKRKSFHVEDVILIGKRTTRVFKKIMSRPFWRRLKTVDEANHHGILKALKGARGSVLYPHSSLVEPWLIAALKDSQLQIENRVVYKTKILALRGRLKQLILQENQLPLGILATSPSLFKALQSSFSQEELRRRKALFMCLGDTTYGVIKRAGFRVRKASKASVETAIRELISHCKARP